MAQSNPTTMLTTMMEAKRLTTNAGQDFVVFTVDQQLYKVAVQLSWADKSIHDSFVLRLGGMHTLMNFVGCVGTLMANTGLEEIMASAFGGVSHMLSGKKFPQNVRALRIVAEEVLKSTLQDPTVRLKGDLMEILEASAVKSKTCKLWLDCLIKPVFIMMIYQSRA